MYEYIASNVRVIDGDTIECTIDLGFYTKTRVRFRFKDLDAPELRTKDLEEKKIGLESKAYVVEFFEKNPEAIIKSHKTDKYGRWLAEIYSLDQTEHLNQLLLDNNLAEVYLE